jgi:hypothetical protein
MLGFFGRHRQNAKNRTSQMRLRSDLRGFLRKNTTGHFYPSVSPADTGGGGGGGGLPALPNAIIQYDMLSVSGATLTDVSGNGNDGTLHGTTQTDFGTTFNGSNDYISTPAVVKNSDFTVIVIASGDASGKCLWWEGDAGPDSFMRLFRATVGTTSRISSTGGDSGLFGLASPPWKEEYHAYYLSRAGSAGSTGMVELPYSDTVTIPGTPAFSGDAFGSLGAQVFGVGGSSQNEFFTGSIAYFALANAALTTDQIQTFYDSARTYLRNSRGVYLQARQTTLDSSQSPIWTRHGVSLANAQEPSVMYEPTNGQLISGPCIKMWFSRSANVHYAESSDGMSWTEHSGALITGASRPGVLKVGATYYCYVEPGSSTTAQQSFDCYTSSDGISWTLLQASVLVRGPGTNDDITINNPCVTKVGSTWVMVHDSIGSGITGNEINLATSPDGLNWTKSPASPITGFNVSMVGRGPQGPFLYQAPTGKFYLWGGGLSAVNGNSDITRFESDVLDSLWAQSIPGAATFTNANNGSSEVSAGDPSFVEMGGTTYMFYGQTPNAGNGSVGLATTSLSMADLVLTTEGG